VQYTYKKTIDAPFNTALEAVERECIVHGFSVSGVHDVHLTLAAKGFTISPLRIYKLVDVSLQDELSQDIDLLLPIRVHVFRDKEHTVIAVVLPNIMCEVYPEQGLSSVADGLTRCVARLVDEAAELAVSGSL